MAEDNDSKSATKTQKESNSNNDDNQDSQSNEIELIDLSNDDDDDEEIKEVEASMNEDKDLENGDNEADENDIVDDVVAVEEDDNNDNQDDDDEEEDNNDIDDDEVQISNMNGDINNVEQQNNMTNYEGDEIMISDDDAEEDEGQRREDGNGAEEDDEMDGDEEEDGDDSSSLILENEITHPVNNNSNDRNSLFDGKQNKPSSILPKQNHPSSLNKVQRNQEMNQQQQRKLLNNHNNDGIKEEIIIDDDDDEDEVQDLSTNNKNQNNSTSTTNNNHKIEDLVPKLEKKLIGFPEYFKEIITIGDCMAINKNYRSDIDIDKECSILDCPSQVVPLIIKKSNKFPEKLKQAKEDVKPIVPPSAPNQNTNTNKNMLTISDFYSSSVGKFLMGIGLSRVKQWYHKDAINKVRKQIRKEGEAEDLMEELKKQQDYLNSCRVANSSYIFPTEKCENCDFRSEFKVVINYHLAFPHSTSRKEYKCNYCQFSTRDSKVIMDHVNFMHDKKCKIELPPQLYECPICPYESGVKSKAATHIAKCLKFFVPEKLLINKDDYFPTITPKPITQEDIKIYEATLQALRFAAMNPQSKVPQIAGLPPGLQQQMYMVQQQHLTRIAPSRTKNKNIDHHQPHHPSSVQSQPPSKPARLIAPAPPQIPLNQFNLNPMNLKGVTTPHLYQMLSNAPTTAQFLQNPGLGFSGLPPPTALTSLINNPKQASYLSKLNLPGQIAPQQPPVHHQQPQHHRNSSMQTNNVAANNRPNILNRPHSNNVNTPSPKVDGNPKGSFVMCEICDGYIKDLDQLRTHMHWIHKVRIHPKMLASRPPLNCQKCQWRFFTDQGLERHLLGAHGLVTSNMQDLVNSNQDGGRCTVCGRVFTSKMVTHMNQAHKINLKPAHLSYKCTVCSATFNLYRLFENHVYMVHSGSVKRSSNQDDNLPPRKKTALDMTTANGN